MPKYVFYMQSSENTFAHIVMDRYWRNITTLSTNDGMENEVTKYPHHVQLTSFFSIEKDENLNNIINDAKSSFQKVSKSNSIEKMSCVKSEDDNSDFYNSELLIESKSVSDAVQNLVNSCNKYGVTSSFSNNLYCTLYDMVDKRTMEHIEEYSSIDCVRSTEWTDISIILYETDDTLSYWKKVHEFL